MLNLGFPEDARNDFGEAAPALGCLLRERGGGPAASEQVLEWYRELIAGGTVATVDSVEVDHDAVVLGLAVAGTAEGARPALPQHLY